MCTYKCCLSVIQITAKPHPHPPAWDSFQANQQQEILLLQVAALQDLAVNYWGVGWTSVPSAARCCQKTSHFKVLLSALVLLCSEQLQSSVLCLYLVSFRHIFASPIVLWSHITIIIGKNKAVKPHSERKMDISEGGACLLHPSALFSPLERRTWWIF